MDYETSSGNVFKDLELPDAKELDKKALLSFHIRKIIEQNRFSVDQVAFMLKTTSKEINDIKKGRLAVLNKSRLEYVYSNLLQYAKPEKKKDDNLELFLCEKLSK